MGEDFSSNLYHVLEEVLFHFPRNLGCGDLSVLVVMMVVLSILVDSMGVHTIWLLTSDNMII